MIAPKTNRLLSVLFAFAVLPLLGLYALLMKTAMPNATGGMEPTVAAMSYIAFTVITAALVVVFLNFSRQLARQAKGEYQTP